MLISSLLFAAYCAYFLVVIKLPAIILFCDRLRLYDHVDFYRKDHKPGISRLGGVAIFLGFTITLLFFVKGVTYQLLVPLLSMSLSFLIGINDDLRGGLKPMRKLALQVVASLILSCFLLPRADFFSVDLNYFLFMIFTISIIVIVVNAFNLIDGIDGLAGAIGVLVNIIFGILFLTLGDELWTLISFTLAGAICGFLRYNFRFALIFMGDSGAMLIGFISAASTIRLLAISYLNIGHLGLQRPHFITASLCFSVLIIPIFDLFRILIIRLIQKRSPFVGDRNHIHHKLKYLGIKDECIVMILLAFNILMIFVSVVLTSCGDFVAIVILIIICILCNTWITYKKGRKLDPSYGFKDIFLKDTLTMPHY